MPRLPIYDDVINPRTRVSAPGADPYAGRAEATMANTLFGASEQVQKWQEDKDMFQAQRLAAQARIDWTKKQEERKLAAPEGAQGFAKGFEDEFDNWRANYGGELETRRGTQALESSLDAIKISGVNDSLAFEAASFADMQARELEKTNTEFRNIVRTDPAQLDALLAQNEHLVGSTVGIDAQLKGKLLGAGKQELYGSAMDGMVSRLEANADVTPGQIAGLRAKLTGEDDKWKKGASAHDYDNALTRLDHLQRAIKEKNQAEDRDAFHEAMRQYEATGSNRLAYTEADARALGDTEQEKNRLAKEFKTASLVGGEVARTQDTPFQEDQKRLTEMAAGLSTTDEFDARSAQFQAAQEAFSRKAKEFTADPAGYVLKISPPSLAQYQKYAENPSPETFQNYVSFSTMEQKRIAPGVPPTIIPKAASEAIAQDMAGIGQNESGVTTAAKSLASLQQNSGRYWPQVVRDLYKQKALDDVQMVAANAAGGSSPHIADSILRASGKNDAEWAKLTGEYTATKARDEANAALKPLRASLAAQGNLGLYEAYSNALTRTLLYQRASGQSPDARKLASGMILDEYQFNGSMRVPQSQDMSTVRRASNSVMDNLGAVDIVPPPSLSGDLTADDYRRSVKSFGVWTTSSDETGLVLRDDVGRPVLERKNGVVVPLKRTWSELRTIAIAPEKPSTMSPSYSAGKF